jgi:hypothetical protein
MKFDDPVQNVDRLYRVRSKCLHEGVTQVEREDVELAHSFVDAVITTYLITDPFCNCPSLEAVLSILEPPPGETYEI